MARRKTVLCVFPPSQGVGKLTKLLSEAGFTVVTARSFHSALPWLHAEPPDAILLDQHFSILDGLWSADIIKAILPDAIVVLVDPDDPKLSAVVQTLRDRTDDIRICGEHRGFVTSKIRDTNQQSPTHFPAREHSGKSQK